MTCRVKRLQKYSQFLSLRGCCVEGGSARRNTGIFCFNSRFPRYRSFLFFISFTPACQRIWYLPRALLVWRVKFTSCAVRWWRAHPLERYLRRPHHMTTDNKRTAIEATTQDRAVVKRAITKSRCALHLADELKPLQCHRTALERQLCLRWVWLWTNGIDIDK